MAFWEDETVHVDFWMYLEGNESAQWLFVFDLEESTPVGARPGIRLALVDDQITVEHKYPNPNIHQPDEQQFRIQETNGFILRLKPNYRVRKKVLLRFGKMMS